MPRKVGLGVDVLTAARERIAWTFETFEKIYVSFSGGKDSTVMLHLVMEEATRRKRKVGILFVDLEAQYRMTIEHVENCYDLYAQHIDAHWLALPIALRNAVSQFQPKWECWNPDERDMWVRQPSRWSITDGSNLAWFRRGMEFEELVPAFGKHYSEGKTTACIVGIRADESLNRFRTLIIDKTRFEGRSWTTWCGGTVWNVYPIYDWRTDDLWVWHARNPDKPYNKVYDRMHQAGMSIHQMRICQPYGDDQRKGLWLYHILEPDTWPKVVARVNGVNQGALYAQESGNILGRIRTSLPSGHTWESYSKFLLESMPPKLKEHYEAKISQFIRWHMLRGYSAGIPDEADPKEEAARRAPSWRRIARVILKNDYWCKGLTFSQTKSESYEKYLKVMKNRRMRWGI